MANIVFNVPVGPVNIRDNPALKAAKVGELLSGEVVDVVDNSRTEAEGYVWWRHKRGWSAEKTLDGKNVLMAEITDYYKGEAAPKNVLVKDPRATAERKQFIVLKRLNTRSQPTITGAIVGDSLPIDSVINVFADSRTEADGLIWWRHAIGWSAESTTSGTITYMVEVEAPELEPADAPPKPRFGILNDVINVNLLPSLNNLIVRYPLDLSLTEWIQYYGNTQFALRDGALWNYDGYAQGLHSGMDFGRKKTKDVPIFAGVMGSFVRIDRYGLRVRAGNYIVIYQHIIPARSFFVGEVITPDTVLGIFDPAYGDNTHLHFEVRRLGETHIVNPLYFMTPALRETILDRFKPYSAHFVKSDKWTEWQTPLEQPVITVGGKVIGIKAQK